MPRKFFLADTKVDEAFFKVVPIKRPFERVYKHIHIFEVKALKSASVLALHRVYYSLTGRQTSFNWVMIPAFEGVLQSPLEGGFDGVANGLDEALEEAGFRPSEYPVRLRHGASVVVGR